MKVKIILAETHIELQEKINDWLYTNDVGIIKTDLFCILNEQLITIIYYACKD